MAGVLCSDESAGMSMPFVTVNHLTKWYEPNDQFGASAAQAVRAVTDVSFAVAKGETLGVRAGSACLNTFLRMISGASAGFRLPRSATAG
jgi:ABC-type glutathione transport system ATPase component